MRRLAQHSGVRPARRHLLPVARTSPLKHAGTRRTTACAHVAGPSPPSWRGVEVAGLSRRRPSSPSAWAPSRRGRRDAVVGGRSPVPVAGVAVRRLSGALEALSPRGGASDDAPFFGVARRRPVLEVDAADFSGDSLAFRDLFRAISKVNVSPPLSPPAPLPSQPAAVEVERAGDAEAGGGDSDTAAAVVANDGEAEEGDAEAGGSSASGCWSDAELERRRRDASARLGRALRREPTSLVGHRAVLQLFEECRSSARPLLDDADLDRVFHYLLEFDLAPAYAALKYHARRRRERGGRLVQMDRYQRLIRAVRAADLTLAARRARAPRATTVDGLRALVADLVAHLREEYADGTKAVYEHLLLPELALALCHHRQPAVRRCAGPILDRVLEAGLPPLDPDVDERILVRGARGSGSGGGAGQECLPLHRLLSRLVAHDYMPRPEVVINLLHSYYPYHDNIEATHGVLSTFQKILQAHELSQANAKDYRINLGTLEAISLAAAGRNLELNLLAWDMMEAFGHAPTEGMFEDVILSFAATRQDENMFLALVEMGNSGFMPSRALLRYLALKVSYREKRLHHSQKMLSWRDNGHLISIHSMNVLLMGYIIRKDINATWRVYTSMFEGLSMFNLKPDANTFAFLMESLYINTKDRFPFSANEPLACTKEDIEDTLGASEIIVEAMEEAGVKKTKHFFHEHMRLFCALGLLENALSVFQEALSVGHTLLPASIVLLATRLAHAGDFEMARAVAESSVVAGCGELPHLDQHINNIESQRNQNSG